MHRRFALTALESRVLALAQTHSVVDRPAVRTMAWHLKGRTHPQLEQNIRAVLGRLAGLGLIEPDRLQITHPELRPSRWAILRARALTG